MAASFVAAMISGLYRTNAALTYSVCTFAVLACGVLWLPIKRVAPLSNLIDTSLVPRHFPVHGEVSILPDVPPKDCAIIPILSCKGRFSYCFAISTAFFCKSVRGFVADSACSGVSAFSEIGLSGSCGFSCASGFSGSCGSAVCAASCACSNASTSSFSIAVSLRSCSARISSRADSIERSGLSSCPPSISEKSSR